MKTNFAQQVTITFLIICTLTTGCSQTVPSNNITTNATQTVSEQQILIETEPSNTKSSQTSETTSLTEPSSSNPISEQSLAQLESSSYEMKLYTQSQNQDSSVYIEYPTFYNIDKNNELNSLILKTVQDFSTLDPDLFSQDTKYTVNYQSKVTLQNSNIVSIVFWGTTYIEGSAFPTSDLKTLNIDLQSLKTITLTDLYNINENFEKVFFEKSFYPSTPVTSYEESSFSEMLKQQTSEYITVNPFRLPNVVSFFLESEGIVLSLPTSHASGDHFEAKLLYSDIQSYYLPEHSYWEK